MSQAQLDAAKIIIDKMQHIMNELDYIKEVSFLAKAEKGIGNLYEVFDYADDMVKSFFEDMADMKVTMETMLTESEKDV
jgi:hypothetical protein